MSSCGFNTFVNLWTFFFFFFCSVKAKQHQVTLRRSASNLGSINSLEMQFTDRQYTTQKKTLIYLRQELLFHKYSYEMNAYESFKNLLPIDFLYGS